MAIIIYSNKEFNMSTRANVLIINNAGKIFQFYHHFDGYLNGVGKELKKYVKDLHNVVTINEETPSHKDTDLLSTSLVNLLSTKEGYIFENPECDFLLSDINKLHGDIELLYIIKDSKIYYVKETCLSNKYSLYKELIDNLCIKQNLLNDE